MITLLIHDHLCLNTSMVRQVSSAGYSSGFQQRKAQASYNGKARVHLEGKRVVHAAGKRVVHAAGKRVVHAGVRQGSKLRPIRSPMRPTFRPWRPNFWVSRQNGDYISLCCR